ncbi:hypothetical protein AB205_0101200, partial [Aquarana catesbeiana]
SVKFSRSTLHQVERYPPQVPVDQNTTPRTGYLSRSTMSQASSEDLTAPLSPSPVSESGSVQSLRGWTIPKLTAELRRRGMPFSATARKGKLFKLLFPPPAAAGPSTQQASLQSISSAISQLHTMVSSLSTSVTDVQTRVALLEARLATAIPDPTAIQVLTPLPAGTTGWSPIVYPSHLVPASIRKDILDGRDVNLACLLISVHDLAENKAYTWGDVSVVLKAKDPRLNRKLSVPEFTLAFGMLRDVLCSAAPSRREELDLYLHTVVDLGYKYKGFSFCDYHFFFRKDSSQAHTISDNHKLEPYGHRAVLSPLCRLALTTVRDLPVLHPHRHLLRQCDNQTPLQVPLYLRYSSGPVGPCTNVSGGQIRTPSPNRGRSSDLQQL